MRAGKVRVLPSWWYVGERANSAVDGDRDDGDDDDDEEEKRRERG